LLLLPVWFSACADKDKIREGIYRGVYEGSLQTQERKDTETLPSQKKEPLTYEQYKKERDEMIKDQTSDPGNL